MPPQPNLIRLLIPFIACVAILSCKAGGKSIFKNEPVTPAPEPAPADNTTQNDNATPAEPAQLDRSVFIGRRPSNPKVCAAVRGNGPHMNGHFAGMARYMESYGVLEGIAGGSSASITTFLYESIYASPLIRDCGANVCSAKIQGLRAALLMKSIHGVMDAYKDTPEASAIQGLLPAIGEIQAMIEADPQLDWATITANSPLTPEQTAALVTVLQSERLKRMINPEIIQMLQDPNPEGREFRISEVQKILAVAQTGELSAPQDPSVFLRPGLLNFDGLALVAGEIGDFLAANGSHHPYDAMKTWLDECAFSTQGKDWWGEIAGTICETNFRQMVVAYLGGYQTATFQQNRINEPVGKYLPAMPNTAVLEGPASTQHFKEARERYWIGKDPDTFFGYAPQYEWLRMGYWGNFEDLSKAQNLTGLTDVRSQRFISLGEKPWRHILNMSPAEPGIARGFLLNDNELSIGGWIDLTPTLVLKEVGCEQVVYISRRGQASNFPQSTGAQLGLVGPILESWYGDAPLPGTGAGNLSAYAISLKAADAIWCTNWNDTTVPQFAIRSTDAWNAPIVVKSTFPQPINDTTPPERLDTTTVDPTLYIGCTMH